STPSDTPSAAGATTSTASGHTHSVNPPIAIPLHAHTRAYGCATDTASPIQLPGDRSRFHSAYARYLGSSRGVRPTPIAHSLPRRPSPRIHHAHTSASAAATTPMSVHHTTVWPAAITPDQSRNGSTRSIAASGRGIPQTRLIT